MKGSLHSFVADMLQNTDDAAESEFNKSETALSLPHGIASLIIKAVFCQIAYQKKPKTYQIYFRCNVLWYVTIPSTLCLDQLTFVIVFFFFPSAKVL